MIMYKKSYKQRAIPLQWVNKIKQDEGLGKQFQTNHCILST